MQPSSESEDDLLVWDRVRLRLPVFPGQLDEARRLYLEAIALAQAMGDVEAVEQIEEGLKELTSKRKAQAKAQAEKDGKPDQETESQEEEEAATGWWEEEEEVSLLVSDILYRWESTGQNSSLCV